MSDDFGIEIVDDNAAVVVKVVVVVVDSDICNSDFFFA